ncbi:MAG: kelch-like protein, partial [Anaeromyxobacteraceae bacterium]|nr:kelch-like protein [Anaeromyxobacteraceae bacterium]
ERVGHTATLLQGGDVLVAGGSTSAGIPVASAERYDPTAGTWSPTGGMATARIEHSATLLPSGQVIVAGGRPTVGTGSSTTAACERYDPLTGTWEATGALTTPRSNHTATLLASGRILVVGGNALGGSLAEAYDPAAGTWTAVPGPAGIALSRHTATMLPSGLLLIAGGYEATMLGFGPTGRAWLYDPAAATWAVTGGLSPRYFHTATLLPSGQVMVVGGLPGGLAEERYDPAAGAWSATGQLVWTRTGHQATLLTSGRVMVTGGQNYGYALPFTELYW